MARVLFVLDLDHELRVVELLLLGRHREPKARAAAAVELGDRLEDLAGLAVLGVRLAIISSADRADHVVFDFDRLGPRRGERGVLG